MKKEDLNFSKIYKQTLKQVSEHIPYNDEDMYDTDDEHSDEDVNEHEESGDDTFNHHHVCKDIQGIHALLNDIEETFGINDDTCDMSNINCDDLHDHIIDKLNDGCCDTYTSHYINDRILSHPKLTPEFILHSLWYH